MNPFKKCVKLIYVQNLNIFAGVMELADVTDSKSVGSNTVWVRVPPPAPNTEAPVGCLCVWLSQTGLEAGETKRSCGAFCPAGERKQSGRAARSASKGRLERRVPPPAPNQYNPNQIFLIGDGFGLFVFFEKFEDTHFRNGVVKRPESKPRGPRKPKLVKDKEDNYENH